MNNKQGVTESEDGSGSSSLVNDDRLWNPRELANLDSSGQQQSTNAALGQRSGYGHYDLGMATDRLMELMFLQRRRPNDNSIEFWEKIVAEFFTPDAMMKWCVSRGYQHSGFAQQEELECEICKPNPGKAFGYNVKVLPRLFQIEYESGILEKLLFINEPKEHRNSVGQIILDYEKATLEYVYRQYHTVYDGYLRIVFSPELKICSWEFCPWSQEELISRKALLPQINQVIATAKQCKAACAPGHNTSLSELQSYRDVMVASSKQLVKAVELPTKTELRDSVKKTHVDVLETQTSSSMFPNNDQMQQVNPTDGVSTGRSDTTDGHDDDEHAASNVLTPNSKSF